MKKLFLLLLLLPLLTTAQRVVGNNTKPTKSDVIAFMSEIYHTHYIYVADFINVVGTAGVADDVISTVSGTGTSNNLTATTAGRIGLVRSSVGTTATGRAAVSSAQNILRLGDGSWVYETALNVTTLSTSVEGFAVATGFIDVITAMNQVDGVYFLYDERGATTGSTGSGTWQTVSCSNSIRTFNQNSVNPVTVSANAWVTLRIEVNAAGTSAVFKINGATVATHTTNIPTGSGRETGFGWLIMKSVGTTARTIDVDYLSAICALTTAR